MTPNSKIQNKVSNKAISTRSKNALVAQVLGVSHKTAALYRKIQSKDFVMARNPYINEIEEVKSPMLDSIENGITTWLDHYYEAAKLAHIDRIYKLKGIPENTDSEKEEITKMRVFLYNFHKFGYWNISATCNYVGISILDVKDWSERFFVFKEAITLLTSARDDFAESQLLKQMNGTSMPNVTATIFYLKTKGRDRGYSEEINVNHGIRANLTKDQIDKMADEFRKRHAITGGNINALPDAQGGGGMSLRDMIMNKPDVIEGQFSIVERNEDLFD